MLEIVLVNVLRALVNVAHVHVVTIARLNEKLYVYNKFCFEKLKLTFFVL
jgi:hypothetical protein